jgi:hypothetical protein
MLPRVLRSEDDARFWPDMFRGARLFALFAICVGFIAWYALITRTMIERLAMNDFGRFYYSARLFLDGSDMYGPSPATLVSLPSGWMQQFWNMNPPHFHLLILPLALLSPVPAFTVWACASVAGLAISVAVVLKELRVPVTLTGAAWAAAAGLAFAATGTLVITGQLTWVLLPVVTIAWRHARHERWTAAGVWLGIAISVKPFLCVFLPWLFLRRRFGSVLAAVGVVAACFALGWVVFGADAHRAWLHALSSVGWPWAAMNGSLLGFLSRVFSSSAYYSPMTYAPGAVAPAWAASAATVGLVTLYVVWRDTGSGSVDRAFLVLLLSAQLISPLGWVYYLWLAVPSASARLLQRVRDASVLSPGWPDLFALLALPALVWPLQGTVRPEPSAWSTIVPGSMYFFGTALLWAGGVADAYRATRTHVI